MLRKLEYLCLVGCIGLIGADRIDLAAGSLPFILNPFLVLAPAVVLLHILRAGPKRLLQAAVPIAGRRQVPFITAASLFVMLSFLSVPFGVDPQRGLVASADFLIVVTLAYLISVRVLMESQPKKLIVRSIVFALAAYVIFCIGEYIAWTHGIVIDVTRSGPWLQSTFAPATLGPWIPAFSGTTFDSNRAGFILIMYLALLDRFAPDFRYAKVLRIVIGVLVFAALSRSAALCWMAYYLFSGAFWERLFSRRTLATLSGLLLIGSVLYVMYQREVSDLLNAWEITDAVSAKLSMSQGTSGESHVLLIERGFQTWTTSPKTIFLGIGFAGAAHVLQDFFGADKHGNFHSLYITTLAEIGLPAFVVLMFIFCYPIVARKGAARIVLAIMIFNVSYQVHMEPMFWLMLSLVWSNEVAEFRRFLFVPRSRRRNVVAPSTT